jgi:hypothetical protein
MTITVLFFAQAREHAGRARGTLELPAGSSVATRSSSSSASTPPSELYGRIWRWRWISGW